MIYLQRCNSRLRPFREFDGFSSIDAAAARRLATPAAFARSSQKPKPIPAHPEGLRDGPGVKDESGGALGGAAMTVNGETSVARVVETAADGRFRVLELPPGSYSISIERTGFAVHRQPGVALLLGRSAWLECTMTLSAVEERITVDADTPVVDAARTAVATVVGR